MPTPTDLVTDLPADFEVFGQAVDSSMADLKGGTSGQILSKATNTDMDFTWIDNQVGDITAVTADAPLTGGGTTGAISIGIQDATTAQKGAVQLTDSTSSTSATTAATPKNVKAAYDLAAAAIPASTATTAGDLLYRNGSAVTRLGIGTAGQVLKVNTGATAPEWATASGGGGLIKLASNTFSAASSVNPGSYFNSTYKRYKLVIQVYGSTNLAILGLRFRYASNATALTTNYYGSWYGRDYQGSAIAQDTSNGSTIKFGNVSSDSNEQGLYELTFVNVGQGSSTSPGYDLLGFNRGKGCGLFGAGYASTGAQSWDGVDFGADSGTITGSYTLYGLEN